MKYAYTLYLKFSVRCIHPNYLFYSFKCVRRVCPNLSSAPCTVAYSSNSTLSFKYSKPKIRSQIRIKLLDMDLHPGPADPNPKLLMNTVRVCIKILQKVLTDPKRFFQNLIIGYRIKKRRILCCFQIFWNGYKKCPEKNLKAKNVWKKCKYWNTQNSRRFFPITFFWNIFLSPFQRIWFTGFCWRKENWDNICTFCKFGMHMLKNQYIFRHFAKSKNLLLFLPITMVSFSVESLWSLKFQKV